MSETEKTPLEIRLSHVIAEELGEDPDELSPPVDDVINVAALDDLFAEREEGESRGRGLVSFKYRDIYVNVDDQGYVTIEGNTRGLASSHRAARAALDAR